MRLKAHPDTNLNRQILRYPNISFTLPSNDRIIG
jgi:hypothetical protein